MLAKDTKCIEILIKAPTEEKRIKDYARGNDMCL